MKYEAPVYVFHFGMYKGQTLWAVEEINPSYIYWCACNIPKIRLMLRERYKELYGRLLRTQQALGHEREAWCWTGGRMPSFNEIYGRMQDKPAVPDREPALKGTLDNDDEDEEDDSDPGPF